MQVEVSSRVDEPFIRFFLRSTRSRRTQFNTGAVRGDSFQDTMVGFQTSVFGWLGSGRA